MPEKKSLNEYKPEKKALTVEELAKLGTAIVPGSANQAASSAAAVNGSNRIVYSCPRSSNISTLTCLDDPF